MTDVTTRSTHITGPLRLGTPSLALMTKFFRGLADSSRLSILEALRSGSRNVSEIVEITGLTQSNASNHLACLLDCGLVRREQQGRFAVYSLSDPRVDELLGAAEGLLREVAEGVDACGRYALPGEP